MKRALFIALIASISAVFAAGTKPEVVAPGFVGWSGGETANFISGLPVPGAYFRHKVAVVVEFEAEKAAEQLAACAQLTTLEPRVSFGSGKKAMSWEELDVFPRDVAVVFSNRGAKDHAAVLKALAASGMTRPPTAVYDQFGCDAEPDAGGQYPFVYVMGPRSAEPLWKGVYTAANFGEVQKAVRRGLSDVPRWRDFYGPVGGEPKFVKKLAPLLAAERPLSPASSQARGLFNSANADASKEGQYIYDALEQAPFDLVKRILAEYTAAPHCAVADAERLLKYFPKMKKCLKEFEAYMKKNPEAMRLARMYLRILDMCSENFKVSNPRAASKLKEELEKMREDLGKMREMTKNPAVQRATTALETAAGKAAQAISQKTPVEKKRK